MNLSLLAVMVDKLEPLFATFSIPAELIILVTEARTATNCKQLQLWVLSYMFTEQGRGLEVGRGDWVGEIGITGKLGFERFAI